MITRFLILFHFWVLQYCSAQSPVDTASIVKFDVKAYKVFEEKYRSGNLYKLLIPSGAIFGHEMFVSYKDELFGKFKDVGWGPGLMDSLDTNYKLIIYSDEVNIAFEKMLKRDLGDIKCDKLKDYHKKIIIDCVYPMLTEIHIFIVKGEKIDLLVAFNKELEYIIFMEKVR